MKRYTCTLEHEKEEISIAMLERPGGDELLFFIHGLGCTGESFAGALTAPGLKDCTLIIPDLPGFGDSSKPENFSYKMEAHAEVCLRLLENFPHKKCHLVAHSMGGAIGLLMTENLGRRLTSFINIEGNLITDDCSMSSLSASFEPEKYRQRMIALLAAATEPLSQGGVRSWYHWIQKSGARGLHRSAMSLSEWSCSGRLLTLFQNLSCRKVYIHGEANAGMPVLSRLSGIDLVSVPDSGHFPMNDNSGFFYRALADFLFQ